jgi:lipoprotein
MKKISKFCFVLFSTILILVGCSSKSENKTESNNNSADNSTVNKTESNKNSTDANNTLVKKYTITESGETKEIEVKYKDNVAQSIYQRYIDKPIDQLTDKEKYEEILRTKKEDTGEYRGITNTKKIENNKLIAEGTIDLNKIPEEDAKIRIGEFNTSFDEARKIENFEKILTERGLTEKK